MSQDWTLHIVSVRALHIVSIREPDTRYMLAEQSRHSYIFQDLIRSSHVMNSVLI